jgi:hypothetical protein
VYTDLLAYEDGTDSVPKRQHIKFRHQGINPEENMQHTEYGKSLKSRKVPDCFVKF